MKKSELEKLVRSLVQEAVENKYPKEVTDLLDLAQKKFKGAKAKKLGGAYEGQFSVTLTPDAHITYDSEEDTYFVKVDDEFEEADSANEAFALALELM
jgi:hypothetical protein